MQMPTTDQVNSALRHVYTAAGVVAAGTIYIGLNPGVAQTIAPAVHKIGDGISSILAGISLLIPVVSAIFAAWSASPFSRLLWAKKNPEIKQVITVSGTPMAKLAGDIPGDKITTSAAVAK